MKRVRIGMAGLAHAHAEGYLHLLEQDPRVQLSAVWDEAGEKARRTARRFQMRCCGNLDELVGQGLDLLLVCTENTRHLKPVLAGAKAGVDILCEKPLGTDLAEMDAMIEACKAGGSQLMTAFPNRYVPEILWARELVAQGRIGALRAVKASNKGKFPGGFFVQPELSGGGSLMDHVVHVADLMNWFMGGGPQWVCALCGTVLHPGLEVDDVSMVHFGYADGTTVTLDSSWSRGEKYPSDRNLSLELMGTEGTLSVDVAADHNRICSDRADRELWLPFGENKVKRMIEDAVECVLEHRPFSVTGEDGRRAAQVALAAIASARSGQPVQLSEREGYHETN